MLKQLQRQFYQDILNPSNEATNYLNQGNFSGNDLLQIYHNQYFVSLIEALGKTYSCVKRLVGEDFFNRLAQEFIQAYPSKTGNIIDYGAEFEDFIRCNTHCQNLPYLGDVAKFEYCYERCYFLLDTQFFIYSPYPIIKIWQLNEHSDILDFSNAESYIKIYKQGAEVIVEEISEQEYKEKK
ncbi:Conserved domain protein [hydrothermal vent metagenome]|uniref:Conserved domain protein n=1 Tax=hydrothermal vent metagenome TaxID=652676 RepID=A0A1W1E1D8_9ZZZZ